MQMLKKDTERLDGFEALSNAIVMMAASDYINLLAHLKPRNLPNNSSIRPSIKECEDFFRSSWFEKLTGADGEWFMDKCKEKAKELVIVYTVAQDPESERWYVCKATDKATPISSDTYKRKREALEHAAITQGLDLFTYMKIRKRDKVND